MDGPTAMAPVCVLEGLRPNLAVLPPAGLLARAPVEGARPVQSADIDHWFGAAFGGQRPERVCVDLDDTCLHNSVTTKSLWDVGGYYDPAIQPGFDYVQMKRDARGVLRMLRRRPAYDQRDKARYPFLKGPRVVSAPSLPMLHMLSWLKRNGTQLALVTACARERLAVLLTRLPILTELFGDAVYCAEDIVERSRAFRADAPDPALWSGSIAVHRAAPGSLIAKTPWLVSPLFDGRPYEMLIDDSPETGRLFEAHGLGAHLIEIDGEAVRPAAAWACVRHCVARMIGAQAPDTVPEIPASILAATPVIRFEDPLYYPLLHITSQFE